MMRLVLFSGLLLILCLVIIGALPSIAQTEKFAKGYFPVMNSQAEPGIITFRELKSADGLLAIRDRDTLSIVYCDFSIMQDGGHQSMDAFRVRSKKLPPELIVFLKKLKSAKMIMFENIKAQKTDGRLISIKARRLEVRQ